MQVLAFRTGLPRLAVGKVYSMVTGRPWLSRFAPLTRREIAEPEALGDHSIRVRTRLGGICGSDLHMLSIQVSRHSSVVAARRGSLGVVTYPGHEAIGDVVEVGRRVSRVHSGERVVLVPGVYCSALGTTEPCLLCRQGHFALCRRRHERPPFLVGGGWSESFVRHESQVISLPPEIEDETAVLIEPAGCALHAVLRRPPGPGDRVVVVGAGMIGLGLVAALRALRTDVRIVVLCRHGFQAEQALARGADVAVGQDGGDEYEILAHAAGTRVQGRSRDNRYLVDGFDVVYDCVGSARSVHHGLRWCRPHGAVVLEGIDMFPGTLDRTQIWRRELAIVGASGHGHDEWEGIRCNTFDRVIAWLAEGRLRLDGLLTHRFRQPDYRNAIHAASDKQRTRAIRVALDFRDRA